MKPVSLLLFLALYPWQTYAQGEMPLDVKRFVDRRDLCDHFRGEEPYDAERRKFLEARMRKHCVGTDRKLLILKAKYRASPDFLSKLSEYEPRIESTSR